MAILVCRKPGCGTKLILHETWSPGAAKHRQKVCRRCRSLETMARTKKLKEDPIARKRINRERHTSPSWLWYDFKRTAKAKRKLLGFDKAFFVKTLREPCLFCLDRRSPRKVIAIDTDGDFEPDNVTAVCGMCGPIRTALGTKVTTEDMFRIGSAIRAIREKA